MEIAVIGDSSAVLGFQLAGVHTAHNPQSPDEIADLLRDLAKKGTIGLLIITERMAETVREEIREIRAEYPRLIITEIPGPQGPVHREVDPIQELLRRTLGAQINT